MAFLIYSRINNAGSSSARSELDPQSQGIGDGAGKYCLKTVFLLEKFKVRKKKYMLKSHQKSIFCWKRKVRVKGNFTPRLGSINQLTQSAVCLKIGLLKLLHINESLPQGASLLCACMPALWDRKWLTIRRRLLGEQWWVTVGVSKNTHAVFSQLQIVAD